MSTKITPEEKLNRERIRVKKVIREIVCNEKKIKEAYEKIDECTNLIQLDNILKGVIHTY